MNLAVDESNWKGAPGNEDGSKVFRLWEEACIREIKKYYQMYKKTRDMIDRLQLELGWRNTLRPEKTGWLSVKLPKSVI